MTARKLQEKPAQDDKSKLSFEQSLSRLDQIVKEMEDGSISLEKMIEHFEEGQSLIGQCTKQLGEVERRIEILVKKGGKTVTEEFDKADDAGGEAEPGSNPGANGKAEELLF